MQSIPVDTSRLGVLRCAVEPEAKISNFETQEVKKDREGNTIYTVGVMVRQEGRRVSVIEVAVAGEPKGVSEGTEVRITGLEAFAPTPPAPAPGKSAGGA
jgi:hypothetical protein